MSNYFWQPLAAVLFLTLLLFALNQYAVSKIIWAVGAGSLASSCFLIFAKPSNPSSLSKKIIGGYIIGILVGEIMHYLVLHIFSSPMAAIGTENFYVYSIFAAISVGISILLMCIFRFDHPPAAGMSLVLVLEKHDHLIIFIVLIAVIILALFRQIFIHHLKDLV